jgi:AcrR family transcriptional regulator
MNNDAFIEVAQDLFSRYGLKKVTMDDIAKNAHISKATIYKNYKNKNDIFNKVVENEFKLLLSHIKLAVDKETTTSGKLRAHLTTKMTKLQELINFYYVTQDTWNYYWSFVDKLRKEFIFKEKEIVKNILIDGNKSNELNVKNTDQTAHIMVLALKSLEFPWIKEELGVSSTSYIESMLNILMNGLKRR